MSSPVRIGDGLSHGGSVTGGSPTVIFGGIAVSRHGDSAMCAKHGSVSIQGGCSNRVTANGIPIALDGATCSCGASVSAMCWGITVE